MKFLKQLILFVFLCIFFGSSYSQAPTTKDGNFRLHSNIGLGTSAIAGLSFYTDLQFNKSKHNVGINFYHNWHPGSVNIDAWAGAFSFYLALKLFLALVFALFFQSESEV